MVLFAVACGGGSGGDGRQSDGKSTGASEASGSGSSLADVSPEQAIAYGKSVARSIGCIGCHTADGTGAAGPTWLGLFGKEETLDDGTTVIVDEAYLRESILDPNAKVVKDFPPNIMPGNFGTTMTDVQIQLVIDYIKLLK